MRRIFVLIIMAFLGMSLTGCSKVSKMDKTDNENTDKPSMFVEIESGWSHFVVYHKDTKVMYAISGGGSNCGTFTLLVNPDGSPMLYEE